MLWRTLTNAFVEKVLHFKKGAVIKVTADSGAVSTLNPAELVLLDGLTASAAEMNTMDGILATTDELNRAADLSTRVVSIGSGATVASTVSVTVADHEGKVVVLANTHTMTLTLPTASGSGAKYHFIVSTTGTDGSKVIKVGSTLDNMTGVAASHSTATNEASSFLTTATDDTITLNNTTTGGRLGTQVHIHDVATNLYHVHVDAAATGTVATPFSATI